MIMAARQQGYPDDRFPNAVSQNFHCAICLNVFREPVTCQRNQHCFCRPCITRHLENSSSCPTCKDELTLETLTAPPRLFLSCLSEVEIRCGFFKRGCHEIVQLGDIDTHVKNCGFTPVLCPNEGCTMEVNKRDLIHHETQVCEFRKVKCHDCVELRKDVAQIKADLTAVKDEIKVANDALKEMQEIKQKLEEVPRQIFEMIQEKVLQKSGTLSFGYMGGNARRVVIAGGFVPGNQLTRSVELMNWSTKAWFSLQPMPTYRAKATSFVVGSRFVVAGGETKRGYTYTMDEISTRGLKCCQSCATREAWTCSSAALLYCLRGHASVFCNGKLFVIGGLVGRLTDSTSSIHTVTFNGFYYRTELTPMPKARCFHGAQLFKDKIIIVGGKVNKTCSCDVLSYDIRKDLYQNKPQLPFCVQEMATVQYGDDIILLGGADENGNALNTVVTYNIITGKSNMLPGMQCDRMGCTAVVCENNIVVMGGWNRKDGDLRSVECFNFAYYTWDYLTPMNEARRFATAVLM